jgi:hypothetical protein
VTVIDLAEHRRGRAGEPSTTEARLIFEDWLAVLPFAPRTREALARRFDAVLNAAADGDELAKTTWRLVTRAIDAPARISGPGESGCQPIIDRVTNVDALLLRFSLMQTSGA